MTRPHWFAREWLWWIQSWLLCAIGVFLYNANDHRGDLGELLLVTFLVSLALSVPLYVAFGIIRITFWAIHETNEGHGNNP